MRRSIFLLMVWCIALNGNGQTSGEARIALLGFYNFENLFDLEDDSTIRDEEFLPSGSKAWDSTKYFQKLNNLDRVVSEIGTNYSPDGLCLLGVSEVENVTVLQDFVKMPKVRDRNYQIVHFNSPDKRGIDVGLLYNPKYFNLLHAEPLHIDTLRSDGDTLYTRDILYVKGVLDGDTLHVFVNHWPSRSGGEKVSRHLRNFCANVCQKRISEIQGANQMAKIVLMGDLNDDPISPSVKYHVRGVGKENKMKPGTMFNPMISKYKRGIGTTAWRDAWSLFDQILLSKGLLQKDGYHHYATKIFNKKYLVQKSGRFQGYPMRTFAGDSFLGGYSDHFPVFTVLVKELND